jgi:hypothetical protein
MVILIVSMSRSFVLMQILIHITTTDMWFDNLPHKLLRLIWHVWPTVTEVLEER